MKKRLLYTSIIITAFLGIIAASILFYYGKVDQHIILKPATFTQLPGWQHDNHAQALISFQQSCHEILTRDPHSKFNALPQSGTTHQWQAICAEALKIQHPTQPLAQQFFEQYFEPYTVINNFNHKGLFTGYYLPLIHGDLKKSAKYHVPIYGVPADLVKINLSLFRPEFAGKSITGQVKNNALYPYPDRAAINANTLPAPILAWSDNMFDVFFAQIQGSVIVELPNHKQILLGYAADNGKPYTSIGKALVANGAFSKASVSMQAIRNWLLKHPDQAIPTLNNDPSYVFFKLLTGTSPLGTEQVPLTPERSLAVDMRYIPLGTPVWLDTTIPQNSNSVKLMPYRHLLIAQDTGGAIKGVIRGDIYWGAGESAAENAGHMKASGQYWLLFPKI